MSQPEVFETLRSLLREASNAGLCAPELLAEDDGGLALDWGTEPRRVLSISVSRRGELSWASLVGEASSHGRCLGGADRPLLDAMKRLADANKAAR